MQHYISVSIYGLTLAWITSENSTKQLECRHLDSIFFAGPDLLLLCPESTASLPVVSPTPASSFVQCRLPLSVVPRQLPLRSFLQPTLFRVPLPLLDTARFQVPKPFVWFRAKTDKGIVCLAGHLYSVTEGDSKASFSIAYTPRSWGGCDSFRWIVLLGLWNIPYCAEC